MMITENGINELNNFIDSLIVIPNDKLSSSLDKDTSLLDAFSQVKRCIVKCR